MLNKLGACCAVAVVGLWMVAGGTIFAGDGSGSFESWQGDGTTSFVGELEPDHFGLEQQYTTFGIGAFSPQDSSMAYDYGSAGYIYPTNTSNNEWIAAVGPANGVPVGATVLDVCAYVYDNSATERVQMSLGAYEFGSASDDAAYQAAGNNNTGDGDTPGYTAMCISPTNFVIRSFTDFAGDATQFYGYQRVGFSFNGTGSDTRFGGIRVRWQRQLSPAPGSATFSDVPTNHPFYQHIEALVDSSITSGCGATTYCPDSPVTRGQMAVFLAKALGLNWPF